jgi:uncharacterized protein (DUF305 family)
MTMARMFTRTAPALLLLALLLSACGAAEPAAAPTAAPATADSMAGMDHGAAGMDHGVISAEGAPYDAAFIDGMIAHHDGAIIMANQALEQAERPEIRSLADAIISAQEAEIGQMKDWRMAWYPELAETSGMVMDMGPMEVPAGAEPFEQRFIQAMIPHHESAITMARDALQKAEHQEIKDLASAIITAQQAEIDQMQQWLAEWYGL